MAILKVDEWQDPTHKWHVADVHTWATWRHIADVLDLKTIEDYVHCLTNKYNATNVKVIKYDEENSLVLANWAHDAYKHAHQFKLDVNRIARKKQYEVK